MPPIPRKSLPVTPAPETVTLTPYQVHVERWKGGCGAEECSRARKVCLARGTVPCDVLFLGEGPGQSEDVMGRPFVGPAGELLQRIIDDAVPTRLRYALTNVVGCLPTGEDGLKSGEPADEQVRACQPRLVEFVALANPRLLVCVGKTAEDWTDSRYQHRARFHREYRRDPDLAAGDGLRVCIQHPAAILRANVTVRGLSIQKCIVTIASACEDL